jgi:acetyl-CoA acetyltransferase
MNDGSAAAAASPAGAERAGIEPMARVVSRATSGVEPHRYGIGPVTAALTALQRADLKWDDIDSVELNEAFAAQSLACLRGWPDLDPAKVNPLGGAISIGHPLGASGARILTTLVHHLAATGGRYGVASMCIGVGQHRGRRREPPPLGERTVAPRTIAVRTRSSRGRSAPRRAAPGR